ncbi:hypothetical protein [Faecalitalea cylindroides]|jgi:hypothetical protein|uniref:DUF4834 domain-containing protein n=1 Tax=Faecalitalea cylindroides ATCC 27803 TaxID=649755 RepID=U2P3J7_9FIRM|nr:hypothetical protein [Faecalitalea cylindroides]ERK45020.1 hypothetical protein HMPREF0367_01276 [[Eubacterium] cylindroides ATCC 27803] [Faecalitalea cylindroides ATCC 27803]MBM6810932.1 hypothetical protein [Faecalitalea cylindroides]MEE1449438.1 hypothetical protein [Faecalitalea cylindroides]CDD49509.1 putative uncharacterized protein [Firmicutes bacterium CAG:308]
MNLFFYFIVILIIFILIGYILPFLAPILLFFLVLGVLRSFFQGRKHYDDYEDNTYYEDIHNQSDYTYTNPPKHDAIDVEYTEHEDDGDAQ